jgi:DNA-binding protein YbaB
VDPNQIVASYEQEIAGIAARAEEAKEKIKNLNGTASSPDGAVTVTVNGGGALQNISFGREADDLPRAQLAAAIMTTARKAQAQASQQILAIMGPLVGEDSDAMRFVKEQIPSPEEPEDDDGYAPPADTYPGQQALEDEPAPAPPPPAAPQPPRPPRARPLHEDDDYGQDSPLTRDDNW